MSQRLTRRRRSNRPTGGLGLGGFGSWRRRLQRTESAVGGDEEAQTAARATARRLRRAGFTLLELVVAVFLIAVTSVVMLGTSSTGTRMMGYSNNMTVINMLAPAKMQDLEYEILAEGFTDDFGDTMSGDFDDEGYPDIEWEARVEAIEISDDASNDFVQVINEQLYGSGDEAGSLSGNAAFSQFLPLMISYMPTIINQLGQRIRYVELTLSWDYLGSDQTMTVSQYIVQVEPPEEGSITNPAENDDTDGDGINDETGEEIIR